MEWSSRNCDRCAPSVNGIAVVPSGGWNFPSDGVLGSSAPPHYEPGYDELVTWLRGYRIANGKEVGDPVMDINLHISRSNPRLHGVVPPPPAYEIPQVVPKHFREEVTNWLASLFQNIAHKVIKYVDEDEAERRAKICAACPKNQNWKTGCPSCIDNAERITLMLSQGKRTKYHDQLHACEVFKHENHVAVVLDRSHLAPDDISAPGFCWMKTNE